MKQVQAPIIPIVGQWIKDTTGTISLGQGIVNYPPPPESQWQLESFFQNPQNHHYQAVHGIPELLEAIDQKLLGDNQIKRSDERRIVVTAGSNLGFSNAIFAIADPGDEIILPTPYYFNHEMAITLASCKPVSVMVKANYQLDLTAMEDAITPTTKAIVTVSPNNPTGVVYPESDLRAINSLCRKHGLYHIHDEAYEYFSYENAQVFSPGSIEGSESYTISLYSLSKAYGFASWRIGYMLIPEKLFESIRKIQDTQLICAPVISQYAALGALKAGRSYCDSQLPKISSARTSFLAAFLDIQDCCEVPESKGAFYFLLRLKTKLTSTELVKRLIFTHKIAAIPGETFGLNNGCYLRVAYAALNPDSLHEGIDRLITGLKKELLSSS